MAIKSGGKYLCSYCYKPYTDPTKADSCRDNHDLIYVQISREDLARLMQFILTKDEEVLTESLVRSLKKIPLRKNKE